MTYRQDHGPGRPEKTLQKQSYNARLSRGLKTLVLAAMLLGGLAFQPVAQALAQTPFEAPFEAPFKASARQELQPVRLGLPEHVFPADLSGLNHRPAGARGRVRAQGDALVFADGSPARFWGVNVQANALFSSSDAQIAHHARRLARMGVNLVRLHHHDSHWVRPNIFGPNKKDSPDTSRIDAASMRKIDLWAAQLRAQGIYLWLDLHVGRVLGPDEAGLDFDEIRQGRHEGDIRGYNFVNDDIKAWMQSFAESYLNRINPFTGLAYKDDPAVLAVLISNENDLVSHFANRLLPGRGTPGHAARYTAAAQRFAAAHGLDPRGLEDVAALGPSKLFLADLERQFHADMQRHLRGIGYEGLVAVSNFWGGMPMAGLAALTEGDVIDMHAYAGADNLRLNPAEDADIVSKISAAHVAGMPLSVSEWNIGAFRAPARLSAPFQVAAMAAFQGWDAMMLYGYAQAPLRADTLRMGRWHGATDPSLMATLPAAALLYRQAHVPPAPRHVVLRPTAQQLFGQYLNATTLPNLRQLPHQVGVSTALPAVPELPWLRPPTPRARATHLDPFAQWAAPEPGQNAFRHDPGTGRFTVDTPRSQIITGELAGHPFALGNLAGKLNHDTASVAVQSLGTADLGQASDILVTAALPSWPQKGRKFPFKGPSLSGDITFTAPAGLRLSAVVPAQPSERLTHQVEGTRHRVTFNAAEGALWLLFSTKN